MIGQKIVIITAPSGAGKTSISSHLLAQFNQLAFSISATTRPPRPKEVDGVDYHFVSEETFKQHIDNHRFLEWEMVYEGRYYGTLQSEIDRIWALGKVPVLDIDVHGAIHVQQTYSGHTFSLFIQPPSIAILADRLKNRGTETEESIAVRINKAGYEMSFINRFDAVVINDDLTKARQEATHAIEAFLEG